MQIKAIVSLSVFCALLTNTAYAVRADVEANVHKSWLAAKILTPVLGAAALYLYGNSKSVPAPTPKIENKPTDNLDWIKRDIDPTATGSGSVTTGYMSYPHLIRHLMKSNVESVLLLGAGLEDDGSIPQAHEMLAIFKRITLVDHSARVISAIKRSAYKSTIAKSVIQIQPNFGDKHYQYQQALRPFLDTIPPTLSDIDAHLSDFATHDIQEASYEIIVATLSLAYALEDATNREQAQQIALKYFKALKKNGTLYVDFTSAKMIVEALGNLAKPSKYNPKRLAIDGVLYEKLEIPCPSTLRNSVGPILHFLMPGVKTAFWMSTHDIVGFRKMN
jgi:hypothetical protein